MFYSQTYLGRKGPLGTVWCAAHLQHRLKKSHYLSTDLLKTIDYIMYSEVPIALRMSGHLLLGVVRIYSKKIDYLYRECNIVLTGLEKISVQLDLPEDARQAPPQAITLPGTFQLDAMDMDDPQGDQDTHLKDREEITLIDLVPTGMDPYVAVSFDEDILNSTEGLQAPPDSAVRPGDTETLVAVSPSKEADTGAMNQGSQHPGPSTPHGETPGATERDSLVQNIPEIEIMRDAVQDFSMDTFPPLADHQNDLADLVMSQSPNDKRVPSPIMETVLASGGTSQLMLHSGQLNSAASDQAPEIHDAHVNFDHPTPEIAIRSSPPLQQPPLQQPRPRPRRRRQFFDETVVLTNSFMKKALEDRRDILRKRKSLPRSSLGLWKLSKRQRKEQVLDEPVMSGISMDLCNLYKDYILPNPLLVQHDEDLETMARATPCSINEALSNGRAAESPVDVMPGSDMEIERLRDDGSHVTGSAFPEFSHLPAKSVRSPSTRDDFTPLSSNFPSASDFPGETTIGTSVLPTPDAGASTGTYGSDMETPLTFLDECLPVENTRLPDIPETNVEDEDLFFLEADSSSPAGFSETQGVHSLSVRTRAVAQYLQRHSPSSVSQEPESLSLNTILEGKTRRLCARMFFETLVLKSYGLVDVQQAEPYGDVSLKLTPTFSKADI